MPQANQQAIADRLGISRATVSRCFTNHTGISPVTRARVFQVAAEIGYTHMESRAPSSKTARDEFRISVLVCSDQDEYFGGGYASPGEQILAGVSEYVQAHSGKMEVNLIPPHVSGLNDPAFREVEGIARNELDGILLIYPFPKTVIDQLALRYPLVSLVDQVEHEAIDCVDVDHFGGISAIVDHLVAAGHRKIGFYTRDYPVQASWSFRRFGAFAAKMAQLKLEVSAEDIIGVFPSDSVSVPHGIRQIVERTQEGVTAWVCAADHQAYDLVHGLEQAGLNVPTEVSVTGFDGIKHQPSGPSLTTVQIPFRSIGNTGVERLASRLRKRFAGKQRVHISGQVRAGETVAPPSR